MGVNLAPVPLDDPVVIIAAILFFAFAAFCGVALAPLPPNDGQRIETQRGQGRFHWIAYGIIGLVVLMALGVV